MPHFYSLKNGAFLTALVAVLLLNMNGIVSNLWYAPLFQCAVTALLWFNTEKPADAVLLRPLALATVVCAACAILSRFVPSDLWYYAEMLSLLVAGLYGCVRTSDVVIRLDALLAIILPVLVKTVFHATFSGTDISFLLATLAFLFFTASKDLHFKPNVLLAGLAGVAILAIITELNTGAIGNIVIVTLIGEGLGFLFFIGLWLRRSQKWVDVCLPSMIFCLLMGFLISSRFHHYIDEATQTDSYDVVSVFGGPTILLVALSLLCFGQIRLFRRQKNYARH